MTDGCMTILQKPDIKIQLDTLYVLNPRKVRHNFSQQPICRQAAKIRQSIAYNFLND